MLILVTVRRMTNTDKGTNRYETSEVSSKYEILKLEIVFSEHLAITISMKVRMMIHKAFFPILGSKLKIDKKSTALS